MRRRVHWPWLLACPLALLAGCNGEETKPEETQSPAVTGPSAEPAGESPAPDAIESGSPSSEGHASGSAGSDGPVELSLPLQVVADLLRRPGTEAVLYQAIPLEGSRWVNDGGYERPNPALPHRTLDAAARGALADLVRPGLLSPGEEDLLAASFLLEVLEDGVPLARIDFHTERAADDPPGCLFLSELDEERTADGCAQLDLSEDGRARWLEAVEAGWTTASPTE
jgi:hypothetical protein